MAFTGAAFLVQVVFVHLAPRLCSCFDVRVFEMDDEHEELRGKINELVEKKLKMKPMKVQLTESRGGDLHSNASCNALGIRVSKELLENHKEH